MIGVALYLHTRTGFPKFEKLHADQQERKQFSAGCLADHVRPLPKDAALGIALLAILVTVVDCKQLLH